MKRSRVRITLIVGACTLSTQSAQAAPAQAPIEVSVDLAGRKFVGALPYDVPVRLVGAVHPAVSAVEVVYRLDKPARDSYWPACEGMGNSRKCVSPTLSWTRGLSSEATTFAVTVGPLHANRSYVFDITVHAKLAVGDKAPVMRQELAARYRDALLPLYKLDANGVPAQLNEAQLLGAFSQVTPWLQQKLAEVAPFKVSPEDIIDPAKQDSTRMLAFADRILDAADRIRDGATEIEQQRRNLRSEWAALRPQLLPRLEDLLASTTEVLDAPTIQRLAAPVNAAREGGAAIPLRDATMFLLGDLRHALAFDGLVDGKLALQGTAVVQAEGRNPASLEILSDAWQVMLGLGFRRADRTPAFSSPLRETIVARVIEPLRDLAATQRKLAVDSAAFAGLAEHLPVSLTDVRMAQDFRLPAQAVTGDPGGHPYVSADAGVAYATENAFFYGGVNFYLTPVRRATPISAYRGVDRFRKRFSLLVGLTRVGFEKDRVQNLVGGGALMTGAGFRVTNGLKANVGVISFRLKDANPTIVDSSVEHDLFAGLSFDADVADFLGELGKLIPFNK